MEVIINIIIMMLFSFVALFVALYCLFPLYILAAVFEFREFVTV